MAERDGRRQNRPSSPALRRASASRPEGALAERTCYLTDLMREPWPGDGRIPWAPNPKLGHYRTVDPLAVREQHQPRRPAPYDEAPFPHNGRGWPLHGP